MLFLENLDSHTQHIFDVFLLFTIPIGGGIPAGVSLGHDYGLGIPLMSVLYFLSDICLAFTFEPLMKLFLYLWGEKNWFKTFSKAYKETTFKTIASYGENPSILSLIGIAFGVDPMTGRAVAKASGHGFLTGWAIAITGDMFFFWVVLTSTLFLKEILGDGTAAVLIVMVMMIFGPRIWTRLRSRYKNISNK